MPRKFPKPFFRTGRGWYLQLGHEQIKLADGPDNAATEAAAWERYHTVMAARSQTDAQAAAPIGQPQPTHRLAAIELFDKYLDWCGRHRKPRTYAWYKDHIEGFLASLPDARVAASALRPFHVIEGVDKHPSWGACQRRGAIVAIQRPYNWAAKLGYIETNPLAHVEKPAATRRETFVSPEEWAAIRDHYPDGDPFRDLLEFCWETGCRPQEAKAIEARHVAVEQQMILFPPAEAKGGKRWRRILLEGRAAEIVERLLAKRPHGRLFLNARGRPWTAYGMANRFQRLKTTLGVKYFADALRHGFATRMLTGGIDHLTVARDRCEDRLIDLVNRSSAVPAYATFAEHLSRHFESWFTFLTDPSVPATNWAAEQAIRPAVVNRKVWGGNRTWVGAHAQGVLTSVLETCRRQTRSALDFVSQTLRSFRSRVLPTPVLLGTR